MEILIITPVKFPAPYLQDAIASVQENQGDFQVTHLIIYQGHYTENFKNIDNKKYKLRYVYNSGHGVSQNRNIGLRDYKKFDLIAFLDADDMWAPNIISAATEQIKCVDVVSFYGLPIGSRNKIFNFTTPFIGSAVLTKEQKILNYIGCPSGVFFRKDAMSVGFNEKLSYYEDYDFYLNNFLRRRVKKSTASYFYYRVHDDQATKKSSITDVAVLEKNIKLIKDFNLMSSKKDEFLRNIFLIKQSSLKRYKKIVAFIFIFIIYPPFIIHQVHRIIR